MVVNDDAGILAPRVVLGFIASMLAPTTTITASLQRGDELVHTLDTGVFTPALVFLGCSHLRLLPHALVYFFADVLLFLRWHLIDLLLGQAHLLQDRIAHALFRGLAHVVLEFGCR